MPEIEKAEVTRTDAIHSAADRHAENLSNYSSSYERFCLYGLVCYRQSRIYLEATGQAELKAIANPTVPGSWFDEARRTIDKSYEVAIAGQWVDAEPAVKPASKPDPYEEHRSKLISKLKHHERYDSSKPLDQCVALSMEKEDNAPDLWKGEKTTPRERLVAALAKELNRPAPVRFPHPHEGRSDRVYRSNGR